MSSKVFSGVDRRSSAPAAAPTKLTMRIERNGTPSKLVKSLRYPQALARAPGKRATTLDALAITAGTPGPAKTSAGKVNSVPPPAMAFITPATPEGSGRKQEIQSMGGVCYCQKRDRDTGATPLITNH